MPVTITAANENSTKFLAQKKRDLKRHVFVCVCQFCKTAISLAVGGFQRFSTILSQNDCEEYPKRNQLIHAYIENGH